MTRKSALAGVSTRRTFLATGATLLSITVAGCGGHPPVVINMREVSEGEIRDAAAEASLDEESVEQIRAEYLFTLTGLSGSEREVVEEATSGGYYQDSDAFKSVVDRFRDQKGLEVSDTDGSWLVEYQGVSYVADIEW